MSRTRIRLIEYWERLAFGDRGRPPGPNSSEFGSVDDPRFWDAHKAFSEEVGAIERLAWDQVCRDAAGGRITIVAHRKLEGTSGWYSDEKLTPTLEKIPPSEFRGPNALQIGPFEPVILYYPSTKNIFNAPYQNPFVDLDEARISRIKTKAISISEKKSLGEELRGTLLKFKAEGVILTQGEVEREARKLGIPRKQARKIHGQEFPLQKQGRRPGKK